MYLWDGVCIVFNYPCKNCTCFVHFRECLFLVLMAEHLFYNLWRKLCRINSLSLNTEQCWSILLPSSEHCCYLRAWNVSLHGQLIMIHVTAPPLRTGSISKGFFAFLKVCVFILEAGCSQVDSGFDGVKGKVEPGLKHSSNPDCPDNPESWCQASSTLPQNLGMKKPNCPNQIWEEKVSTHWRIWVMPPSWHRGGAVTHMASGGRQCEAPKMLHLLLHGFQDGSWKTS